MAGISMAQRQRHVHNHTQQQTNTATCAVLHIHKVTNCMIEWTLPCNYRLEQYARCPLRLRLALSLHLSPKPLTRWLPCNDHWNGSFCLIDIAWTLWHVSIRDHSSSSNDCRCGSQSPLMTSATGGGKCPPCCLCHSVHLSVTKTPEVTGYFGRRTDENTVAICECVHSSVCTWRKDTPPKSWAPMSIRVTWMLTHPTSSSKPTYWEPGSRPLFSVIGDRWREHMQNAAYHMHRISNVVILSTVSIYKFGAWQFCSEAEQTMLVQ